MFGHVLLSLGAAFDVARFVDLGTVSATLCVARVTGFTFFPVYLLLFRCESGSYQKVSEVLRSPVCSEQTSHRGPEWSRSGLRCQTKKNVVIGETVEFATIVTITTNLKGPNTQHSGHMDKTNSN